MMNLYESWRSIIIKQVIDYGTIMKSNEKDTSSLLMNKRPKVNKDDFIVYFKPIRMYFICRDSD